MHTKTDEQIQKDILEEFKWDARVAPNEIGVTVKNGVVTLTGYIDSYFKRWAAEDAAHRVRGVKAVANELEVKLPSTSERTDEEIAAEALHTIEGNILLANKDIHVTVSNGWVTLNGEVEWNFQKEEVERNLRRLWGVKGVTNLITVKQRATPAEVKEKIKRALERLAEVDAANITVDVQGSKAILKGKVRSWAERQEAERAAWVAPGITQVEDQIQVAL